MKRWLLIGAGTASLFTGLIGIIVPVLPTTPFLLLAAFCYWRSSPRLYKALLRQRYIGPYIKNYLEKKGMSLAAKIWTLSLLWIGVGCSAAFLTDSLVVRIILLAVLTGVTTHILLIQTIRIKESSPSPEPLPTECTKQKIDDGTREKLD
jgi:uncharacterized membrane protein YbaN (DUF454 family)